MGVADLGFQLAREFEDHSGLLRRRSRCSGRAQFVPDDIRVIEHTLGGRKFILLSVPTKTIRYRPQGSRTVLLGSISSSRIPSTVR